MSRFELNKSDDGKFNFSLKGDNGETLLVNSKPYFSKGSAMSDISSIRNNCEYEDRYERKEANGKYFFNLQAANHAVLGVSEEYPNEQMLEDAIALAKSQGTTGDIQASA
ncbi:YegP family protein [Porticoccus litoralis]|jgi:uncharacterized protein YegP (UPF0339 family)|uniref:YegP family protein n=1 Tax=Porticoccus litoralis TaxID=434086 RepID=A0AAW8B443_9GAMM|nr:YegP family protein [Porticoccus litoralis]MDP1520250.1 YegP family protein [Porticoccus litoralis]TNE94737.1 MAG: DUF1508 domain-containing protein [Gammaproteobacteria bacterium]